MINEKGVMDESEMPLNFGFTFDFDSSEWSNEDLGLWLYEVRKMDMYKEMWFLHNGTDNYDYDGLFQGDKEEMIIFLTNYMREHKLKTILDGNN